MEMEQELCEQKVNKLDQIINKITLKLIPIKEITNILSNIDTEYNVGKIYYEN